METPAETVHYRISLVPNNNIDAQVLYSRCRQHSTLTWFTILASGLWISTQHKDRANSI